MCRIWLAPWVLGVTMAGGVPPALAEVARAQHDVVSREQALAAGMTVSALWHRVRPGGAWRPVVPGVYLTYAGTTTGPQREMAALLHAGPGSVITAGTALARHGIRAPRAETIDVLVPASRIRRSTGFVRIQRSARMPGQTWADGPLVYTLPARAVADLARGLTDRGEVQAVVADALRRGRCTVAELAAELDQGPVRGSALLRRVLAELPDRIGPPAGVSRRDLIKPAPAAPADGSALRRGGRPGRARPLRRAGRGRSIAAGGSSETPAA